jgi:hypothetical protein
MNRRLIAERVRRALRDYRNLSYSFRYGGMVQHHKDSKAALEAFDRLMDVLWRTPDDDPPTGTTAT